MDGNVARVFARVFAIDEDMRGKGLRLGERLADRVVAALDPGDWNQALMELGATVCTPRTPRCENCPLASLCLSRADGQVASRPVLGAKAAPKRQRVQSIVAVRGSDGGVLLARRRSDRRFGGLWEPPSIDGPARLRVRLAGWLPIGKIRRVGTVEHSLSHRLLTVDVMRAELTGELDAGRLPAEAGYDRVTIVSAAGLEALAMATLTQKVLAKAAGTPARRK